MDSQKNKNRLKKLKAFLIRILPILLILGGSWITLSSLYHFSRGYFADKRPSKYRNPDREIDSFDTDAEDSQSGNAEEQTEEASGKDTPNTQTVLYPIRPDTGEAFGELYIPVLDVTLPIYEGTDEDELEKGVGHFAESVLPGENDNSVLSGHRDTVFRKLGKVGKGNFLVVRTSAGEFKYKVYKVRIVDADDRTVIVPKPRATLTVSTCYPFDFIGSAPERYILSAYLAEKKLFAPSDTGEETDTSDTLAKP